MQPHFRNTSYHFRDLDPSQTTVSWLWDILDEMSEEDKVLFMIFVSGRSRLPTNPVADLSQRFQVDYSEAHLALLALEITEICTQVLLFVH